jgi:hypothetical protein
VDAGPVHHGDGARRRRQCQLPRSHRERRQHRPGHAASDDHSTIKLIGADGKEFSLTADDVAGLQERHAIEQSRKATMPADANGYKIELPADFQQVAGSEVRIDQADPAWADAKAWAHRNGISQDEFSKLAGVYAAARRARLQHLPRRAVPRYPSSAQTQRERIDAIAAWWNAHTGDDGKVLKSILTMAPTAGTVKSFENLMRKFSTQGSGGYSRAGRDAGELGHDQGKVSDAEYQRMTVTERKDYAARFDQSQFRR